MSKTRPCRRCGVVFSGPYCRPCQRASHAAWKARQGTDTIWTCERCSTSFTGRKRRFCSSACREYVRTAPVRVPPTAKPCGWCGAPFTPSHQRGFTYCSNACRGRGCALKALKSSSTLIPWASCLRCHTWFIARNRIYCPHGCPKKWPKPRRHVIGKRLKTITCKCGEQFTTITSTGDRRTCDRCKAARRAAHRRTTKHRRRARKRGAQSEPYERNAIFERDGWRCQLCGYKVRRTAKVPHPKAPVLDHVLPLAAGGDDTPRNVQCAHFLCNSVKGDRVAGSGEQMRLMG